MTHKALQATLLHASPYTSRPPHSGQCPSLLSSIVPTRSLLATFLFLATFTGFFLFRLGGILATPTLSVTPFLFAAAFAVLLRVTLCVADLVTGAIVNKSGVSLPIAFTRQTLLAAPQFSPPVSPGILSSAHTCLRPPHVTICDAFIYTRSSQMTSHTLQPVSPHTFSSTKCARRPQTDQHTPYFLSYKGRFHFSLALS